MKEQGLSLVEIITVMGIVVVVGALLMVIIVNSAGLFTTQSSRLNQGLNINDALSKIRQGVKEADSIDATSTDVKLVLKVPSVDSAGNIIASTFDDFTFLLDQNKLRFTITLNALSARKAQNQIFSTSVDILKFQYLNSSNPPTEVLPASASKVRITLTLKQKTGAGSFETNTAASEANLRND